MTATNSKAKRENASKKSKQAPPKSKKLTSNHAPKEIQAATIRWQEEIISLQQQQFKTIDEAIEAVAETIVKRYGGGAETKIFLKTIFEIDPVVQTDLRRALKIT